jgi:hypothetical protein
LCVVDAHAQEPPAAAVEEPAEEKPAADTTAARFIPTGVRIGYDLMALGRSQFSSTFRGWEVAADIDFHRFYLVTEYGTWALAEPLRNGTYSNNGSYFRVGVDVNFLKNLEKNMFFLGGRFGYSSYSDQVEYTYGTPAFADETNFVYNSKVIGTWVELTAGLKVKIWKFFWLGATGRFKFGLDLDGNGPLRSYDVPGFGLNISRTWWGFNYYALVRIPFKKEPKPEPK